MRRLVVLAAVAALALLAWPPAAPAQRNLVDARVPLFQQNARTSVFGPAPRSGWDTWPPHAVPQPKFHHAPKFHGHGFHQPKAHHGHHGRGLTFRSDGLRIHFGSAPVVRRQPVFVPGFWHWTGFAWVWIPGRWVHP